MRYEYLIPIVDRSEPEQLSQKEIWWPREIRMVAGPVHPVDGFTYPISDRDVRVLGEVSMEFKRDPAGIV